MSGSIAKARSVVGKAKHLMVISGAGVSTDSGIPDYRSPGRPPVKSIQYQEFIFDDDRRKKYWARSMTGYNTVLNAIPNDTHNILADLERSGIVKSIVTQNVDRLHQKSGSKKVLDLHGSIHHVKCLECSSRLERATLQRQLMELNETPDADDAMASTMALHGRLSRPDGDAELSEDAHKNFVYPDCSSCGGMLKPDVVFFGENIPREITLKSFEWVEPADVVLVLGTSLHVYSSFRLVKKAIANGAEIVTCTRGPTRADDLLNPEFRFHELSTTEFLQGIFH